MRTQFGRSMIEMLGVLAIIGVLSIGGIALYRRAVNNHHANVILDDVNRFAFVIVEKGNYPLDSDISKGDFKESGIYTLTAHQALSAGQFSILVSNVPKGVCEPLVEKSHIEYKVGVVAAGGSVDDEILYDTLNTDLCQEINDVAFYFGDTSNICNVPDDDGPTQCTVNGDCCSGFFCAFENPSGDSDDQKGEGECITLSSRPEETLITSDGQTWTRAKNLNYNYMTWWSAQNWCLARGLRLATLVDLGCSGRGPCASTPLSEIGRVWQSYAFIEDYGNDKLVYCVNLRDAIICHHERQKNLIPLCR